MISFCVFLACMCGGYVHTYMYSMGHKKVPVPFTWNGISTVLCVAFPYRFRVYNFRTSNFDAFDARTYWKV